MDEGSYGWVACHPKWRLDELLADAAAEGLSRKVRACLAAGADPSWQSWRALNKAAMKGSLECIMELAPVSNVEESGAAKAAAGHGREACLAELISRSDRRRRLDRGLMDAVKGGHVGCVRMLVEAFGGSIGADNALCEAAKGDQAECVRILSSVANANHRRHAPLWQAAMAQSWKSLEELLVLFEEQEEGMTLAHIARLMHAGGYPGAAMAVEAHVEKRAIAEAAQQAEPRQPTPSLLRL